MTGSMRFDVLRNNLDTRLLAPARGGADESGMQGSRDVDPRNVPRAEPQVFTLSSDSFADGGVIPEHLAGEKGVSPQLSWSNLPEGTRNLVIIMDDPDAESVVGHTFVHWVAALPASRLSIAEAASTGGWRDKHKVLTGDWTSTAYRGPRPPSGTHRYHIAIYAMGGSFRDPDFQNLASSESANDTMTYTRERFESLFRSDILAKAEITGTYSANSDRSH